MSETQYTWIQFNEGEWLLYKNADIKYCARFIMKPYSEKEMYP